MGLTSVSSRDAGILFVSASPYALARPVAERATQCPGAEQDDQNSLSASSK